jgi:Protein of unknown function DUF115
VPSTEFLTTNLDALAPPQRDLVARPSGQRVQLIEGVWRVLDDDGHALAIHGRYPDREADRTVAELLAAPSPPSLVIAVGLGLGFLLDALERRNWSGTVLALEPEADTIAPLLSRRDWTSWIGTGRLRLLMAPEFTGASTCWSLFGDGSSTPPIIVNPALAQIRPAEVQLARLLVKRLQFDAKANLTARRQYGARYLLNTLANLPAIAAESDVSALTDATRGVPAILVGAGPSLDSALPALRAARDSAIVIAVDTALRPLLQAGIEPHLAVAVDPGEANTRHLWDLPACPRTHLVSEASVDPLALEHFRGRTFLFSVSDHQPWPWLAAHGQARGSLRAWGSVLTLAFDLAIRMGCDPIVFTGADLSFPDGRTYCRGVAYEEGWRRLAEWGVPYESQWQQQIDAWPRTEAADVAGALVRTAPHLVAVRDWLVEQIGRESSRRFINASGTGILHGPGLVQSTLDAALASTSASASGLQVRPCDVIRARYRPATGERLLRAARALLDDARARGDQATPATRDVLNAWLQFADGLTRERIVDALSHALGDRARTESMPLPSSLTQPAQAVFDAEWIVPLATTVPLLWMHIPVARMEPVRPGVRLFRFRTTAARLIGCALRMPDRAVAENGIPLRSAEGVDIDALSPGEYCIWRDEIYLTSTDGSDPRYNHRTYAMLVPSSIAYVETLPLAEILRHYI